MVKKEDAFFCKTAKSLGYVTEQQAQELMAAQDLLESKGEYHEPIQKIAIKKGWLDLKKVRLVMQKMGEKGVYKRVGKYELVSQLGKGGMGTVVKARDTTIDRYVALKILPPNKARDKDLLARFEREAQAIGKLVHPNLMRAYESGEYDGYHFIATEYIDGKSLQKITQEEGKMEPVRAASYILEAAQGLAYLEENNFVHRDIKPDNLIIDNASGALKIIDLGLAKESCDLGLTADGMTVGTPHFISPEMAQGERQFDVRTDIYSLGATFYYILTGKYPFDGDNPNVVMLKHIQEPLVPVVNIDRSIPKGFAHVIGKMMAKKRMDRYQTAKELIKDLEALTVGEEPPMSGMKQGIRRAVTAPKPREEVIETAVVPIPRSRTEILAPRRGNMTIREEKSSGAMVTIIILLSVLIFGGISFVVYLKMHSGKDQESQKTATGYPVNNKETINVDKDNARKKEEQRRLAEEKGRILAEKETRRKVEREAREREEELARKNKEIAEFGKQVNDMILDITSLVESNITILKFTQTVDSLLLKSNRLVLYMERMQEKGIYKYTVTISFIKKAMDDLSSAQSSLHSYIYGEKYMKSLNYLAAQNSVKAAKANIKTAEKHVKKME